MVGRKYKVTKKDKNFLLVGIIAGMVGGILGNFMVSSLFALFSLYGTWWAYLIVLIFSTASFFWLAIFLLKKIEPNR